MKYLSLARQAYCACAGILSEGYMQTCRASSRFSTSYLTHAGCEIMFSSTYYAYSVERSKFSCNSGSPTVGAEHGASRTLVLSGASTYGHRTGSGRRQSVYRKEMPHCFDYGRPRHHVVGLHLFVLFTFSCRQRRPRGCDTNIDFLNTLWIVGLSPMVS